MGQCELELLRKPSEGCRVEHWNLWVQELILGGRLIQHFERTSLLYPHFGRRGAALDHLPGGSPFWLRLGIPFGTHFGAHLELISELILDP